ncbi:MAG: hypothetical protein R3D81_04665 [Thalassovita sp.]
MEIVTGSIPAVQEKTHGVHGHQKHSRGKEGEFFKIATRAEARASFLAVGDQGMAVPFLPYSTDEISSVMTM